MRHTRFLIFLLLLCLAIPPSSCSLHSLHRRHLSVIKSTKQEHGEHANPIIDHQPPSQSHLSNDQHHDYSKTPHHSSHSNNNNSDKQTNNDSHNNNDNNNHEHAISINTKPETQTQTQTQPESQSQSSQPQSQAPETTTTTTTTTTTSTTTPAPHTNQKLTIISYATDAGPARHLRSFSEHYKLDLHLIGVDQPWGGFNDKINGFYNFIESLDNVHNESIVLILDAYDTVPICHRNELLDKFNAFDADIVMSTGKDCWPDPDVSDFLYKHLSEEERENHKWFPWFLCPNSGAIMGRHDAMLSMFRRVQKLVSIGNGSCADFQNNKFSRNTQSDQRCYTTYYVELVKYQEAQRLKANESSGNSSSSSSSPIIDIAQQDTLGASSADGTISKEYFLQHAQDTDVKNWFEGIRMRLDYSNDLFLSMGGMMFMDIDADMFNRTAVTMRSKITNGSACIIHGNGPGVILWRSFIKQITHDGNLYVDDYVLRVGADFFHWMLWWLIMPGERLSHWLSITYGFDMGVHSSTFSETVIWKIHIWVFIAVVILFFIPLLYWYRNCFRKNMKVTRFGHKRRNSKDKKEKPSALRSKSFSLNTAYRNKDGSTTNILSQNHPITQQLVKGLVNFEIMVHHNGNTFPLLKTQKNN
eukprot:CAMPEP_0202708946 /NCGR_PEP_ID=MMETSP1385-20130828/21098_1 /ASSEMBLY_ACC=CAM_ASM_000861 /TAXON_ID=933848 /ORGANISM="Elphidium margaritaceum" /LENGTH=641 /DNA_ID=CAMNT_0049368073 /DNA_START=63 /DNA_END=1988 /DNA_ORIENTATION=-